MIHFAEKGTIPSWPNQVAKGKIQDEQFLEVVGKGPGILLPKQAWQNPSDLHPVKELENQGGPS